MKKIGLIIFVLCAHLSFAQTAEDLYDKANKAFESANYKDALKKLDKAIALDSMNADYYNLKAVSLIELKRYQAAYDAYTIGLKHLTGEATLYGGRGSLMYMVQQFDDAIEDYTTAIHLAHDSLKQFYYNNRATAKIALRKFEGAYEDLLMAYEMDSTNIGVLNNLGMVCDEIGRGDETITYLLKVVELDSTFVGGYANLGFKYQLMGEHEKAIRYFDKALALDPNEALGYSNRSYSKLKLNDLKGAMQDINKSIKLYPANSWAYRNRALIYIEKGKTKKACEDIQKSLDLGFSQMYGDEVQKLKEQYCGDE